MMIALYTRVSTAEQNLNGYSMPEQADRLQNYCKAMGWKHTKLYTDGGFSGANTDRPALQKLIKDVKAHRVEKVIVYKLDRLSRSQRDTLSLIEDVFLANDCDFVSMSENFDTATPLGRAMIGILAVFAQLEREQIKERMIMGKEARAKMGKYHGSGNHPIGYDYINGELVINDAEAVQIRQVFEWFVGGVSVPKIVKRLNDDGLYHRYGRWQESVLRHILKNKIYIGYIRSKDTWYKGTHESILSEDLFNKAQDIIEATHAESIKYGRRYGQATSLLGGLIYCAECGNRFAKKTSGNRNNPARYWEYYTCNTRRHPALAKGRTCDNPSWQLDELESLVFNEIKKLRFEKYTPNQAADNRPDMLAKKLSDVEQKINRLIDLYADGTLSHKQLEAKIKSLNEQKTRLVDELNELNDANAQELSHKAAVGLSKGFQAVLNTNDYDKIRAVLTALIDRIEIGREDITIFWNFS